MCTHVFSNIHFWITVANQILKLSRGPSTHDSFVLFVNVVTHDLSCQTGKTLLNEMSSLMVSLDSTAGPITIKASKWLPSLSVLPHHGLVTQFMNWLGSANHVLICAPGNMLWNIYSSKVCESKNWKHPKTSINSRMDNALRCVHVMIY